MLGLRCWDRSIGKILDYFLQSEGNVDIFITADHNEFTGENGLWGHTHATSRCALVPMILLSNRQTPLADKLRSEQLLTAFAFTRLIAERLGTTIETEGSTPGSAMINSALPSGIGSSMLIDLQGTSHIRERRYSSQGLELSNKLIDLRDVREAETYAEKLSSKARKTLSSNK